MGESRPVQMPQPFDGRVGVRGGLEISNKVVAIVSPLEPADTVVELIGKVLQARNAAAGTETAVIAKVATTRGDGAIHVGTSKARVEAHFLHASSEFRAEK